MDCWIASSFSGLRVDGVVELRLGIDGVVVWFVRRPLYRHLILIRRRYGLRGRFLRRCPLRDANTLDALAGEPDPRVVTDDDAVVDEIIAAALRCFAGRLIVFVIAHSLVGVVP